MNKKIISIMLLSVLLAAGISSIPVSAKQEQETLSEFAIPIIASEISIETSSQIDAPIAPSDTKKIDITVKFKLNMGNLAKRLFFNRRIGRLILFGPSYILKLKGEPKAVVNLSIECLTWCYAELDKKSVEFTLNNVFETADAQLTFSLNKTAPALEANEIKIKAEFKGLGGMKASSNETTISFMPAYTSEISYDVEKEINITSTNETIIPLSITNNGNGDTIVKIEIENTSENLNISIEQENITIPVNDTKQVNLFITPTKSFKNETINIKLIPKSTYSETELDEEYLEGETISLSIKLIGTIPEDEEGIPLFEILIAGIVIIILIAVIAMILVRKKKQQ